MRRCPSDIATHLSALQTRTARPTFPRQRYRKNARTRAVFLRSDGVTIQSSPASSATGSATPRKPGIPVAEVAGEQREADSGLGGAQLVDQAARAVDKGRGRHAAREPVRGHDPGDASPHRQAACRATSSALGSGPPRCSRTAGARRASRPRRRVCGPRDRPSSDEPSGARCRPRGATDSARGCRSRARRRSPDGPAGRRRGAGSACCSAASRRR